jgi:integrase
VATDRTLIALPAVAGMRIGEAISLDCGVFDTVIGLPIIRNGRVRHTRRTRSTLGRGTSGNDTTA